MPDWEERITRESEPSLHVEHDLRYRLAAPLIVGSGTWCDLGCGNGVAAAATLDGAFTGRGVLVDVDEAAVETAAAELGLPDAVPLAADLTDADALRAIRDALLAGPAPRTITCFEVVEHLETFIPLVDWLVTLAEAGEATAIISVPNDAFWSLENPHHRTMWGEAAFAELEQLLPPDAIRARQVALHGSAVVLAGEEAGRAEQQLTVSVDPAGVPSHLLAAFGPDAARIAPAVAVTQVDLDGQRAWQRQREANLASVTALIDGHDRQLAEWREYIHELERRLGLPLSGT